MLRCLVKEELDHLEEAHSVEWIVLIDRVKR